MFVKIYHNALVTLHMTGVFDELFYCTFCFVFKILKDWHCILMDSCVSWSSKACSSVLLLIQANYKKNL